MVTVADCDARSWTRQGSSPELDGSFPSSVRGGYTITGTGFGAKDATTPVFEDFEGEIVGAVGSTINSLNVNDGTGVTVVSTGALTGTRSLQRAYSPTGGFPMIHSTLSGTRDKVYVSAHIRFEGNATGSPNVWKHARTGSSTLYTGSPRLSTEFTSSGTTDHPTDASGILVSGTSGVFRASDTNEAATSPVTAYPTETVLFYEMEFYCGTLDTSDAEAYERVSNLDTITWTSAPYLTSDDSSLPTWAISPMNGHDGANGLTLIMDNVYIDESRARVVMTDNATYTSSTKWAIQPIETYSSTQVTCAKKRQGFGLGETAYLHLFDDSGVLVDSGSSFIVGADS